MLNKVPRSGRARTACPLVDPDGRRCPAGEVVDVIGVDQPAGAPIWLFVVAWHGGAFAAFPEELDYARLPAFASVRSRVFPSVSR